MNKLKFCGLLLLHLLVALIGTAIISSFLGRFYTPNTISAAVAKEWVLSVVCAAIAGFFAMRRFRSASAAWTWTLPMIWFCWGLLMARNSVNTISADSGIWARFSGAGCSEGIHAIACRNFLLFTIPLTRSISYSVGARLCSWLRPDPPTRLEDIKAVNLT
jgi:hypothetical protein